MKIGIEKQWTMVQSLIQNLTEKESDYVKAVCKNLLNNCSDLASELELIINDSQIRLKDDERISRTDKIYLEMQDRFEFSQSFANQVKILVLNRVKEKQELDQLSSLHGVK